MINETREASTVKIFKILFISRYKYPLYTKLQVTNFAACLLFNLKKKTKMKRNKILKQLNRKESKNCFSGVN